MPGAAKRTLVSDTAAAISRIVVLESLASSPNCLSPARSTPACSRRLREGSACDPASRCRTVARTANNLPALGVATCMVDAVQIIAGFLVEIANFDLSIKRRLSTGGGQAKFGLAIPRYAVIGKFRLSERVARVKFDRRLAGQPPRGTVRRSGLTRAPFGQFSHDLVQRHRR